MFIDQAQHKSSTDLSSRATSAGSIIISSENNTELAQLVF